MAQHSTKGAKKKQTMDVLCWNTMGAIGRAMNDRPDDWPRVTAIFHGAVALEGDARATFLAGACGDDAAIRDEVEALQRSTPRACAEPTAVSGRA